MSVQRPPKKRGGDSFDAKQEATQLKDKIQNAADKESVEVMVQRLAALRWPQRVETAQEYRELTGKELHDDLNAISEPTLHTLIKELLTDRVAADVAELSTYFQKVEFYYRELVEFFCLRTNIALAVIATEYSNSQDISISEELQEVDDEGTKNFLLGICKGEFSEGSYTQNEIVIRKDALMLAKAPKTLRWIARDGKLHQLLQTRCHAHVRDVIYDFEEVTGENFLDAIEAECSLDFLRCMESFDFAISSTPNVFAKKLMQFLLDGNPDGIVRVFANALETNLAEIIAYYEDKFQRPFVEDLQTVVQAPLLDVMKRIIADHQKDQPRQKATTSAAGSAGKNGGTSKPTSNLQIVNGNHQNGGNMLDVDRSGSGQQGNKYKFFTHGTVSPLKTFDPYRDVHDFRVALENYPSNDLPLIYLISSKTNHQRQVLKSVYSEVFDKSLIDEVMETVGEELDFFMAGLLMKPEEFDATFLRELIQNGAETSFALLEILCSKTVKELKAIGQQYLKKYGVPLSVDMEKKFSASLDLRFLLCELAEGKRKVGWNVDKMLSENDAREMYAQFYRDSPEIEFFVEVLTTRSREQLRETFRTFRKFAGIDVLTALEPLFTAEFAEAVRLLVLCVEDRVSFFAYCLNEYIQNNDFRNLIRLVISRSEIDLVEIKAAYQGFYNLSLLDDLRPMFESKQFRLMSGIILDK
ncbi:putative Annexin A7 [Hypsibius exemplaris]|uniref:Annexin A7 n=1 Tax=Hypsibius exemplaris TaxID=2072580 RepID=A0A1W0WT09_HYPEX|nr:putative Annexin A7 [Hypsibius exemplaris]